MAKNLLSPSTSIDRRSRRAWLIAAGRYLALGVVTGVSWTLIRRDARVCRRVPLPCGGCRVLEVCQLPPAQQHRSTRVPEVHLS